MQSVLIALEAVCIVSALTYLIKAESLRRQAAELSRILSEQKR